MSDDLAFIQSALNEYRQTPESVSLDLKMSFSRLIIEQLGNKGWTQRMLAERTGKAEPFISRVLHGDENCTFNTAGQLLHAIGIRARVTELFDAQTAFTVSFYNPEQTYGEKTYAKEENIEEHIAITDSADTLGPGGIFAN